MPDNAIPSKRLRILCVDDDVGVLEMLAALLSREGYEVSTATDGEQALQMVTSEGKAFDIFVTDAAMPRRDGKGFLAAAVEAGCRAQLIVFSASFGSEDFQAFTALGAEIVKKPDLTGLLAAIRSSAATA